MKHTMSIGKCLSFLLSLAVVLAVLAPAGVHAGQAAFQRALQEDPPGERIMPSQRGLEKLAPDLEESFALWRAEAAAAPASRPENAPVMVSALIQPNTDVQRFFLRAVVSRPVAGMQWVTGEIQTGRLGKLASLPGVLHVISIHTYETAEAPGLDALRSGGPGLTISEMRALLAEGGPNRLRERIDQVEKAPPVQRRPSSFVDPSLGGEAPLPVLLDVHDAASAHERGYRGDGVVVAVVDTGVDFSHPDLQGTQAVIQNGPYAGWPFAYDVLSGAYYAMNQNNVLHPYSIWNMIGATQYVRALPVHGQVCTSGRCEAALHFIEEEKWDGDQPIPASWPDRSRSGAYFYSAHPDLLLAYASYSLSIHYDEAALHPPVVIVSDESQPGVYDTVYVDLNYNHVLGDPGERLTRASPLGGVDLNNDGTWDLSAGMLTWISDGVHHPPGIAALYPNVEELGPPAAGQMLAFINDQDGHGTNCASEVAGQGRVTDPYGIGPTNPLYAGAEKIGGVGGPVIRSMAPAAKLAAFQNGFSLPLEAWTLAVLGMDGAAHSGDEAQIVSNSWGDSRTIADGWDPVSRFAHKLSQEVAEEVTFLVATGNGGHGYGTVTSPGGGSIIDVGASTAYGAVRGFEQVSQEQFLYGDVAPWSNRGPGGLGDVAPDVTAVGAWGNGAQPLNYYYGNGQAAYDVFGGTSMSTPVAAGSLALVYQAYRSLPHNQRWPTWEEARTFLLGSAQTLGYDSLTQGSGNVQVGRAVDMVTGLAPWIEPQQWQAGGYQGQDYSAFPSILSPGSQDQQEIVFHNPTSRRMDVGVSSIYLNKVHEETFSLSFIPPPPETLEIMPILLEDITGLIDSYQPDLVRAQVIMPFDRFDVDGEGFAANWWSVNFYDWQDRDQDGRLWLDADQNGKVDNGEIDIDPQTGLYEYNRFTYAYPQSTVLQASLGSAGLDRRHDGVFLGLNCYFCGHSVTLQVKLSLYQEEPWDWLTFSRASLPVRPDSDTKFTAALSIPVGIQPGIYEGAIELAQGSDRFRIPVISLVAADSSTFEFGGTDHQDAPYNNGELFGGFNWNWRYEAGDWRFFYYDLPAGSAGPGRTMVVDTSWDTQNTDLDTWAFGAGSPDPLANPLHNGPQGLDLIAGSADTYLYSGRFAWQTNTGTTEELVGVPVRDGLGMIALHNVLSGGLQLAETYAGRAFLFSSNPTEVMVDSLPDDAQTPLLTGSQEITLTSTGDIPQGVQVRAYGFSSHEDLLAETVYQNVPPNLCTSTWIYPRTGDGLLVEHAGLLDITTHSDAENLDLDLFLYRDNGDGRWDCSRDDLVAYSMNADAKEQVTIYFPQDGHYWVSVFGNGVPDGKAAFDFHLRLYQGAGITLRNQPAGPIAANIPFSFTAVVRHLYSSPTPSNLEGLLLIGPPADPRLLEVPIRLRPTILIYPEPRFGSSSTWVRQEPELFVLSFQNQGVESELVQVEIDLPVGLVYSNNSAQAPGSPPEYDPVLRRLTWSGTVGGGNQVKLTFQAAGQPGSPSTWLTIPARVKGVHSGQQWTVNARAGINLYGNLAPFIRR